MNLTKGTPSRSTAESAMCLLSLPEDLAISILETWLLDWRESSAWKLLSALDIAASRKRSKVAKLLRRVHIDFDALQVTGPGYYSLQRLQNVVDFVQWIESREISLKWMGLVPKSLAALNASPYPVHFLHGFVLNILSDDDPWHDARDPRRETLLRPMLEKIPNMAHFGILSGLCRPPLPTALLEPVLQLCGSRLLSLCVPGVDGVLMTSIAATCRQLQSLELRIHVPVSLDALLSLLKRRGGQLLVFKIGFAFEEREFMPEAPAWTRDPASVCEALGLLTHPALRGFGWVQCIRPSDMACDLLMEILRAHPQLQRCELGSHTFHTDYAHTGAARARLLLLHVDGPALDNVLQTLAALPHLPLREMSLHVVDSAQTDWPSSAALEAFAQTHGRGLRLLHVIYTGRVAHSQPLSIARLLDHLPALRSLRCYFRYQRPCFVGSVPSYEVSSGAECLARCFDFNSEPGVAPQLTDLALISVGPMTDKQLQLILRGFPALERLELRGCASVTDSGLAILASQCPDLRKLSLVGAGLTTELGRQSLTAALPRCVVTVQ